MADDRLGTMISRHCFPDLIIDSGFIYYRLWTLCDENVCFFVIYTVAQMLYWQV